jgi:L-gulonate 3-dehydrogenase
MNKKTLMNETIAVIGAGLIGRAWAIVFARAGCQVRLHDAAPEALAACQALLLENIGDLAKHGLIDEPPADVLARITPVPTLAEALAGAALVQENIRETLEAKRAIFAELDRLAPPDAVLASSTSWLMASEFSEGLAGRHRILVGHPVNPPYLVPLVEIAPAPWTSGEAARRAHDLYSRAGQTPVLLKKEITGFLLNRIQAAVLNEALNLYAEGYASAQDLDKVMKDGLGLRWAFMGPFETIDLNAPGGVIDYAQRYGPTFRSVAQAQKPNDWDAAVLARVEAERRSELTAPQLAERTRWRDNRLMALIAHKRWQASGEAGSDS